LKQICEIRELYRPRRAAAEFFGPVWQSPHTLGRTYSRVHHDLGRMYSRVHGDCSHSRVWRTLEYVLSGFRVRGDWSHHGLLESKSCLEYVAAPTPAADQNWPARRRRHN